MSDRCSIGRSLRTTISSGDFNLTARTSCRTHCLLPCLPAKGLGPHTLSSTGFYFYFVTMINISNDFEKIANESPWSFQGIRGNHLLTYLPPLHSPSPPCDHPSSPSSCARNVLMISLRFASIPATFPCWLSRLEHPECVAEHFVFLLEGSDTRRGRRGFRLVLGGGGSRGGTRR